MLNLPEFEYHLCTMLNSTFNIMDQISLIFSQNPSSLYATMLNFDFQFIFNEITFIKTGVIHYSSIEIRFSFSYDVKF